MSRCTAKQSAILGQCTLRISAWAYFDAQWSRVRLSIRACPGPLRERASSRCTREQCAIRCRSVPQGSAWACLDAQESRAQFTIGACLRPLHWHVSIHKRAGRNSLWRHISCSVIRGASLLGVLLPRCTPHLMTSIQV